MELYHKIIKVLSVVAVLIAVFFISFTFYQVKNEQPEIYVNFDLIKNLHQSIINKQNSRQNFNTLPDSLADKKSIKLLFFGDMMLDRHVKEKIEQNGIDYLFKNFYPEGDIPKCRLQDAHSDDCFFNDYDLISCNLEGAVTNNGAHYAPVVDYDFAFAPELIDQLKNYNFNFFNLANNHFYDQGERGIIETRDNLDKLGFYYSGCQDGAIAECSSEVINIAHSTSPGQADIKIGIAGFSMVYSKLDMPEVEREIRQLASTTDLVVVNMHWGQEYEHQFNQVQQDVAYQLIDAGADVIIGHHPHVIQGLELYKNKPIFYSLGNFIFDQYFLEDTQQGLAVSIHITDEQREYFLFPFESKLSQVELMEDKDKKMFLEKLVEWSKVGEEVANQIKLGKITTQIYE